MIDTGSCSQILQSISNVEETEKYLKHSRINILTGETKDAIRH